MNASIFLSKKLEIIAHVKCVPVKFDVIITITHPRDVSEPSGGSNDILKSMYYNLRSKPSC